MKPSSQLFSNPIECIQAQAGKLGVSFNIDGPNVELVVPSGRFDNNSDQEEAFLLRRLLSYHIRSTTSTPPDLPCVETLPKLDIVRARFLLAPVKRAGLQAVTWALERAGLYRGRFDLKPTECEALASVDYICWALDLRGHADCFTEAMSFSVTQCQSEDNVSQQNHKQEVCEYICRMGDSEILESLEGVCGHFGSMRDQVLRLARMHFAGLEVMRSGMSFHGEDYEPDQPSEPRTEPFIPRYLYPLESILEEAKAEGVELNICGDEVELERTPSGEDPLGSLTLAESLRDAVQTNIRLRQAPTDDIPRSKIDVHIDHLQSRILLEAIRQLGEPCVSWVIEQSKRYIGEMGVSQLLAETLASIDLLLWQGPDPEQEEEDIPPHPLPVSIHFALDVLLGLDALENPDDRDTIFMWTRRRDCMWDPIFIDPNGFTNCELNVIARILEEERDTETLNGG